MLFAEVRSIAIINSKEIPAFNDAIAGFKEDLKQAGYEVNFSYYNFAATKDKGLIKQIADLKPAVVLTLGTEATTFAKENIRDFPIVFSMVLDPVESGIIASLNDHGENITGVSLDISVDTQLKELKRFLPNAKRVGMLYNQKKKKFIETQAKPAASKLGLELMAEPVYAEADVVGMLEKVLDASDCLLASTDTLVYNKQSAQYILLATLRHKTPFMAFSYNYVKAGALFALECDYRDIGSQSAQAAIRILGGEKPGNIPIYVPRKTRLVVNRKIADVIGVTISPKILAEAHEIYEGE
jgi:putative ABC transport system substrate-binding protein